MVITGSEDNILHPSLSLGMARELGAHLLLLNDVGHGSNDQVPDVINRSLESHFTSGYKWVTDTNAIQAKL